MKQVNQLTESEARELLIQYQREAKIDPLSLEDVIILLLKIKNLEPLQPTRENLEDV